MTKPKVSIQFWSALAMLVGGYALAVAGFITPPKGEISDSVLWIFSHELAKERIRRAGKKIKEESPLTTQDLDTGFRVLKLDSTNMQDIYYSPKDISQADLFSQVDNVKPDRTGEDLLFQVMLELGATLNSKIETTTVAGKTIYNVAEGYLVACFDPDVTDDVVKAIAQMQPAYAVLRDTSMKDDSTATNFEQIFKTYSPDTVTRIL